MPPSVRTLLLMLMFSCARLVMASAARLTVEAPVEGGPGKGTKRLRMATRPGSAPCTGESCAPDPLA